MRTIRRLYLYLVVFISLETVLWGMITLVRSALDTRRVGGAGDQLAGALAFLIVGIPVFLLHWWLVQRNIGNQPEERSAGLRAVFLYGVLFALILPLVQNVLAIIDRFFIGLASLPSVDAFIGSEQSLVDNLVAILMNGFISLYFFAVLRRDWRAGEKDADLDLDDLRLARRVHRYAWTVYALGLGWFGAQQILEAAIDLLGPVTLGGESMLANGLAALLVGGPLWWAAWRQVQASLAQPAEQDSTFRMVFLYLLAFAGMGGVLILLGRVIFLTLIGIFGAGILLDVWVASVSSQLAGAITFGAVWYYHARVLRDDLDKVPSTPRRDGLQRLYRYVLAFAGLVVVFSGLLSLAGYLVDALVSPREGLIHFGGNQLASGLSSLLIGLPLWLRSWLQVSRQSGQTDESGDHARRSIVRKGYLYLAIFIGVLGVMFTTGNLIFELLRSFLGDPAQDLARDLLRLLSFDLLFAVLLVYHWRVLQRDNRRAARFLADKQSLFPVLVLDPGDESFSSMVVAAIREEAPGIPVAVHFPSAGAPGEALLDAGTVIMPAAIAANPPESLRIWLNAHKGEKVVVPLPEQGWIWVDTSGSSLARLAKRVANVVRELAEGVEVRPSSRISPWIIAAAIFGGLVALLILTSLLVEVLS